MREDLYLRIMDVVASSGTGFAFPSQMQYGSEEGIDPARARWPRARSSGGARRVRCPCRSSRPSASPVSGTPSTIRPRGRPRPVDKRGRIDDRRNATHAAHARTLRLLEHHPETGLQVAGRTPARRLRGPQHRGLRVRRRQGRGHRPARPGPEPQHLQLARLRQSRGHLALFDLLDAGPPRRGPDEHPGLRGRPRHPGAPARPRRRDSRPRRHQLRRAGPSRRGGRAPADRTRHRHHRASGRAARRAG